MSISMSSEDKKISENILKAYEVLASKNLIFPGSVVTKEDLELALNRLYVPSGEPGFWEFLGSFLLLKSKIESEGFFITQSGLERPCFRILDTEEMADYAFKKLMKNLSANYKISYIMAAHDISKLTEKQKRAHKQVQKQAAEASLIQQKIMFENVYF